MFSAKTATDKESQDLTFDAILAEERATVTRGASTLAQFAVDISFFHGITHNGFVAHTVTHFCLSNLSP
jgi:hypothetical protein